MKRFILLIIIVLPLTALAEEENTPFLKNLDLLLTPPQDFVSEILITSYHDKTPVLSKTYSFFADKETGQFLLVCLSPLFEQGFAYIKRKQQTWAFTPVTGTFFATNDYDFLEGTSLRIEDLLFREYNKNYRIHGKSETKVNKYPAMKLFLRAKSDNAPYDRITLWISEESMLLLKEEAYDSDSNLLKTIRYSGFREKDGWHQPSKILITDSLYGEISSLITIKQTTLSPVPEYVFTRSFVEFITMEIKQKHIK